VQRQTDSLDVGGKQMNTHHRSVPVLLLSLAMAVFVACSAEGTSQTRDTPVGPFEGTTGAELYAQACAACHGEDMHGTDQGPPFIDRIYEPGHHPDVAFLAAAMMGVRSHHWDFGNMSPIEGITEEQVLAIVEHVRSEQRAAGIQ